MYSMPKGDDEFSNLVSREATSAPSMGLYQNDDALLNYGTIDTNRSHEDNKNENIKNLIHI